MEKLFKTYENLLENLTSEVSGYLYDNKLRLNISDASLGSDWIEIVFDDEKGTLRSAAFVNEGCEKADVDYNIVVREYFDEVDPLTMELESVCISNKAYDNYKKIALFYLINGEKLK